MRTGKGPGHVVRDAARWAYLVVPATVISCVLGACSSDDTSSGALPEGGTASGGGSAGSGGTSASSGGSGGKAAGNGGSSSGGSQAGAGGASGGAANGGGGGASNGGASNGGASSGGASSGGASGGCGAGEIAGTGGCVSAPAAPVASGKRWVLTFSEEFEGTDYDRQKLTPCFDWNYGGCTNSFNKGREHYDPAQVRVSGGTAKLVAEPLTPPLSSSGCFENQCTYKSGLLSTARPRADNGSDYLYAFTYGYVSSRMKFPATQGFFTAFWMLPADPSYSYRSEIDIVEILGDDPNTIFMTYHYSGRGSSHAVNQGKRNNGDCPVKDYSQDFHEFAVDWQPGHVAWYIDGTKCDEFTGSSSQIESGPMQIILDLMVDHSWQQDWNVTLQDPTLVRQLEVDYIRVYQQQ